MKPVASGYGAIRSGVAPVSAPGRGLKRVKTQTQATGTPVAPVSAPGRGLKHRSGECGLAVYKSPRCPHRGAD